MHRIALPLFVFVFTVFGWPALVAHAHSPTHAWTNTDDCQVIVRIGSHSGSNHSHGFPGSEDRSRNFLLRLIPLGHEKTTSLTLGIREPRINDTWTAFSLRDTIHYASFSPDTTWMWKLYYVWMVPNGETGTIALIGTTPVLGVSGRVPEHCLAPPPPKCQFIAGFGSWTQQHSVAGDCHDNEQNVRAGSLQSTENGVLFYDRNSQRLGFFTWARVWQALVSMPFSDPQPWHIDDPQPATGLPALVQCQVAGKLGDWTQRFSNAGSCHDNWQHVARGSIQSTEKGVLYYDHSGERLGFFTWERVWQALVPMPFSETQQGRVSNSQAAKGVSTAALCGFSGGFDNWVRLNPGSGTCYNNEVHLLGGSLQSTENGILFYHRDGQRLEFFEWTSTWRALRRMPLSVPKSRLTLIARPGPNRSANSRCQYAAGYRDWINPNSPNFNSSPDPHRQEEEGTSDWVILHTNAGACHDSEKFVLGGVVQSSENGIIFYDRDQLRLEFFTWDQVWHALATAPTAAITQRGPAATHCRFVLGFANWVQSNPAAGTCLNNEFSVSGGSLQSTRHGILFYDRSNQQLGFFNWAEVWQAVASLPFTQPQLPPSAAIQTSSQCQFVLGFASWVQEHADAGACLHSEQFLASGSVQSTQNGILFYDSSNQRLGYFNWEQVWQGLALPADEQ